MSFTLRYITVSILFRLKITQTFIYLDLFIFQIRNLVAKIWGFENLNGKNSIPLFLKKAMYSCSKLKIWMLTKLLELREKR